MTVAACKAAAAGDQQIAASPRDLPQQGPAGATTTRHDRDDWSGASAPAMPTLTA
jgi:hypothetical protein